MDAEPRPWSELRDSGLLWLINATVFHPRGFALTLHRELGEFTGWALEGDGSEPWQYDREMDAKFTAAEATLAAHRRTGIPRCVHHGRPACEECSLNPSTCAPNHDGDPGCGSYAATGMHWDTCPNRVDGPA